MTFFVLAGTPCDDGSEFDFDAGEWTRRGDSPRCDHGHFYGMVPLLAPVRGVIETSGRLYDLSKVSGGNVLLSERCLDTFNQQFVRGLLNLQPVEVLGVEGIEPAAPIPKFFLATVEWGAELDRDRSGLRTTEKSVCPYCGYSGLINGYDSVSIAEGSWHGLDLFSIKGLPGVICVTERVRVLCQRANIAVCGMISAQEWRMPNLVINNE